MEKDKQIEILKGTRVLSQRGVKGRGDTRIMCGDLVYDEKNGEYGIFLGIKPMMEIKDLIAKKSTLDKIPLQTFPEFHTCILMTISFDKTMECDTARIRYTKSSWLKRIEDPQDVQSLSDLETHCRYECFMECNPECSLYKYKPSTER